MNEKTRMNDEEVYRCARCGACLMVCPVYAELKNETASPRAKVQLIGHYAQKRLSPSRHLSGLVDRCLMCGACTANCPSGVRHDRLFMRMRSHLYHGLGENWHLRLLFHFLTHDRQLAILGTVSRWGKNIVEKSIAREAMLGTIPVKSLPPFNDRPFRDQVPETVLPSGDPKGTVLYFTGCGTQHVFGDTGHAVVTVLTAMGFRVEIPQGQRCCGYPMLAHGRMAAARETIETNIDRLYRNGVSAVVTDCATCGSALKTGYQNALKELGRSAEPAERLSSRIRDVTAFILANYDLLEPELDPSADRKIVTYHEPCHARNAQGEKSEVTELLHRLPFVTYVRSSDVDSCCGGGGTFFYDHPKIARKMVSRKIANALNTGADHWLTECPGCRAHLTGNLSDPHEMVVLHPVQLVAQGLVKRTNRTRNVSGKEEKRNVG